jgi:hypothetical protein
MSHIHKPCKYSLQIEGVHLLNQPKAEVTGIEPPSKKLELFVEM